MPRPAPKSARKRAPSAPDRGDVVWLSFDPVAGHEQAKRRPALVLSPVTYNRTVGLALVCPITSVSKGYPFEVPFPPGGTISGVVLADQVRNVDWAARDAAPITKAPPSVVADTLRQVRKLL